MIEIIAYIVGGFIGGWLLAIVGWFTWIAVMAIWRRAVPMSKPLTERKPRF